MTQIEKAVVTFREVLSNNGSKFMLIYTVENPLTETLDCRVTSNSDQQGVRAIMSFLMRPTAEAVSLVTQALIDTAKASAGIAEIAVARFINEGVFDQAAVILLERLQAHYTIAGWEKPARVGEA